MRFYGTTDHANALYGETLGPGRNFCTTCRDKFTVRVGTLFERSKVPQHRWLLATPLLAASKKGMSAHQFHCMFGVTYKITWFMAHRVREAMVECDPQPMGGPGGAMQADET